VGDVPDRRQDELLALLVDRLDFPAALGRSEERLAQEGDRGIASLDRPVDFCPPLRCWLDRGRVDRHRDTPVAERGDNRF